MVERQDRVYCIKSIQQRAKATGDLKNGGFKLKTHALRKMESLKPQIYMKYVHMPFYFLYQK